MNATIIRHVHVVAVLLSLALSAAGCGGDCEKACGSRECGLDSECGESCGTCSGGETCSAQGQCVSPACPDTADCTGRVCGLDPVCGESCGTCASGSCDASGQCQASVNCPADKDCGSRVCGPDPVCGESCGTCSSGSCDGSGQCQASVDCPADKDCGSRVCGPDPVCGESCGTCPSGSCDASGQCVDGGCTLGACTGDQACNPETEECVSFAGSCDATTAASYCIAYIGSVWTTEAVQTTCGAYSYAYSAGDCPTADAVGVCYSPNGTLGSEHETLQYFYSVGGMPIDVETAESACADLSGTFYSL